MNKKILLIILLCLVPVNAYAFPVIATTTSGISALFLFLIGAGKIPYKKNSIRLIMAILFALLIVFIYKNEVNTEIFQHSQEHEYFYSNSDEKNNYQINYFNYRELVKIKDKVDKTNIIFISPNISDALSFSFHSDSSVETILRDVNPDAPLYVLSYSYKEISKKVMELINKKSNVYLVPLNNSDTYNAIKDEIRGSSKLVGLKEDPGYEMAASYLSKYNIVNIVDQKSIKGNIVSESVILFTPLIPFYTIEKWDAIKRDLNPKKETLLIVNNTWHKNSGDIAKFVAERLKVKEGKVSSPPNEWNDNLLFGDNRITNGFLNQRRFLSPNELYALQDLDKDVKVVCFSELCSKYFPENRVLTYPLSKIISVSESNKIQINLDLFNAKTFKYVLAPIGSEETSLAFKIGHKLIKNEKALEGFLFTPSIYYGATFSSGSNNNNKLIYDSVVGDPIRVFNKLLLMMYPSELIEIKIEHVILLSLILGLLTSLRHSSKYLGMVGFTFISLFFDRIFILDNLYYQELLIKPFEMSLLFLCAMLSIDKSKYISGLVIATVMYFYTFQLSPPIDILLAVYMASIIVFYFTSNMMTMYISKLGYKNPDAKLAGEKSKFVMDSMPSNLKGFLLFSIPRKWPKLMSLNGWILRSNHLTNKENDLSGMYTSYKLEKGSELDTIRFAFEDAAKILHKDEICFWLQPYVEAEIYGVASSINKDSLNEIRIEFGRDDEVTEGHGKQCLVVERSKKGTHSDKWVNSLVRQIKKVEKENNGPVLVEFAVQGKKAIILQIKKQIPPNFIEHDVLIDFLINTHAFKEIESESITHFGKSVLNRLYSGSLVVQEVKAFRKKQADMDSIVNVRDLYKDLAQFYDDAKSYQGSLSLLLEEIQEKLKPVTNLNYKNMLIPGESDQLLIEMDEFLLGLERIPSSSLDAGSEALDVPQMALSKSKIKFDNDNDFAREVINRIFSIGICIVHEFASRKYPKNYSCMTYKDVERGVIIDDLEEISNGDLQDKLTILEILVHGEIESKRIYSVGDFLKLSRNEKRKSAVFAKSIPSSLISEVLEAKTIYIENVTELSHIAISCKGRNKTLVKIKAK